MLAEPVCQMHDNTCPAVRALPRTAASATVTIQGCCVHEPLYLYPMLYWPEV